MIDLKDKVFTVNVFFWKYVALLSLLFLSKFFISSYLTLVPPLMRHSTEVASDPILTAPQAA